LGGSRCNKPELSTAWAYPVVVGAQVALIISMLWIFRKVGWL
jgi:Mg2+ and Co2+ transporter CorA